MNKQFYDEVVEGCGLDHNFETLPGGDLSVVGKRALQLSGAQEQRILFARAFNSDSDVYVLDDSFSAVDAHTRAHMFKLIKDGGIIQSDCPIANPASELLDKYLLIATT